jgi:membrane fusion protein (multidrug efflux system)
VGLSALLAVTAACGGGGPGGGGRGGWGGEGKAEDEAPKETAVPVLTTTIGRGAIDAVVSAASTIEAEARTTVHAEATGVILDLQVQEGDVVEKNALLAKIRADAQANGLQRAQTSLAKAKADLARVQSLYDRRIASTEELQQAQVTYDNATLDVRDRARDVKNTYVRAPIAGTVTERAVNEGAFVTNGQQLLSITDFATLVATVYVPEKELDRIRVGQPATVAGKAAQDRRGEGTVKRIAPIVDAATGTVKVTVALPEALVGGERGFVPGMYAEVTLTTDHREGVLLVAKPAVIYDDEVAYVFVAEGARAKRVKVELGLDDGERVELRAGVTEGAEVLLAGQAGLKDGGLIRRVDGNGNPLEPDPKPAAGADAAPGAIAEGGGKPAAAEGA